jgi:hypothetical protein
LLPQPVLYQAGAEKAYISRPICQAAPTPSPTLSPASSPAPANTAAPAPLLSLTPHQLPPLRRIYLNPGPLHG